MYTFQCLILSLPFWRSFTHSQRHMLENFLMPVQTDTRNLKTMKYDDCSRPFPFLYLITSFDFSIPWNYFLGYRPLFRRDLHIPEVGRVEIKVHYIKKKRRLELSLKTFRKKKMLLECWQVKVFPQTLWMKTITAFIVKPVSNHCLPVGSSLHFSINLHWGYYAIK